MAPRNMELQLFRALLLVATCCFLFASMCSAVTEVGDLNKVYGDMKTGLSTKGTPMHVTAEAREQIVQMNTQIDAFRDVAEPCKTVVSELASATTETTVGSDDVDKCAGPKKLFAAGTTSMKEFPKTFGTPHVAYQTQTMPKDPKFYFGGKDVTTATISSFKDWFVRLDLNEQKKKDWESNTKSEVQTEMLAIKDLSDDDAKKGYGYTKQMLLDMVESIKATGILMNTARRLAVSVIAIAMSVFAVLF